MDQQSGDNSPGPSNNKPSDGKGGDPRRRNLGTMIILGVVGFALIMWMFYSSPSNYGSTVPYSFVKQQLEADNIDKVRFQQEFMTGEWKAVPDSPPKGFIGKLSKNSTLCFRRNGCMTMNLCQTSAKERCRSNPRRLP